MTRYNSKIGLEILLPLILSMGGASICLGLNAQWLGVLVLTILTLLIYMLFKMTYYTIDENKLIIRSFFIVNKKVDVQSIKIVRESRNPISAPAASLDRLEVISTLDSVLISPKDKNAFIEEITTI
ncbi:MAG: PH domain-containing protein, partial [Bacteroidia bacterium]|nr:PH domain-containing protein [Bacteroidia bacterium]